MLASDGGSAKVVHALVATMATTGISGVGLIRAMRPGGDAPLEAKSVLHVSDHAPVALQRKVVFVFHMAWRMTASFLATATRAFFESDFLGQPELPGLQSRKTDVPGEQGVRRRIEMLVRHFIAVLGDTPISADLSRSVSSRRQSEIGVGARRASEPACVVESRSDGQRCYGAYAWSAHE